MQHEGYIVTNNKRSFLQIPSGVIQYFSFAFLADGFDLDAKKRFSEYDTKLYRMVRLILKFLES